MSNREQTARELARVDQVLREHKSPATIMVFAELTDHAGQRSVVWDSRAEPNTPADVWGILNDIVDATADCVAFMRITGELKDEIDNTQLITGFASDPQAQVVQLRAVWTHDDQLEAVQLYGVALWDANTAMLARLSDDTGLAPLG